MAKRRTKKNTNRGRNKQSHAEKTLSALSTVRSGNNLNASLLNPEGYTPLPSSEFSDLFRTTGTATPSNRDVLFEPTKTETRYNPGPEPKRPIEPRVTDFGGTQLRGQPAIFKTKAGEKAYNQAMNTYLRDTSTYTARMNAYKTQSKALDKELTLAQSRYKTDLSRRGRNTSTRATKGTTPGRRAKAKFGGAVGRNGIL